jgi:tripartite-type tricarboxylate transporter receptor subunit TctC
MKQPSRLLALAALALAAGAAAAQAYPNKPVTLIINFPPGGLTDLAGRVLAQAMGEGLGQTVVVQNKGGAGGSIGASAIATAPEDGYSMGYVAVAALTTLPQMRAVPYRVDSMEYICRTFDEPVYLLVAPNSRFRQVKELVAFAKSHPDKLNFATVGAGSLPHLAALDFAAKSGVKMAHIPYQGEGPAVTDLLGGQVDLYFGTSAVAARHSLRRLGVATPERVALSPETPTLKEQGYDVIRTIMGGVIAPRGIAPEAKKVLEASCAAAVRTPAYKEALARLKVSWAYSDGASFRNMVLEETARNRVVLREAKLLQSE